jgi:phosphoribosyl 1,2-cyclic phosphodiesterase
VRFAILGSGSQGNCLVVECGQTRLLLDCGFSTGETVRRLARIGLSPDQLSGILITHEHDDHIGGAARLARKYRLPVWLTPGTLRGLERLFDGVDVVHRIEGYAAVCLGEVEVYPFPVPHDAREPSQFLFSDGDARLVVLTDVGCATPLIARTLSRSHAVVIECNHDQSMLADGDYPVALKQRIASRYGHLDNQAAADLIASVDCSRLQHLVAAHLSQSNNRPELAQAALSAAVGCTPSWIGVADQAAGLDWREVRTTWI